MFLRIRRKCPGYYYRKHFEKVAENVGNDKIFPKKQRPKSQPNLQNSVWKRKLSASAVLALENWFIL